MTNQNSRENFRQYKKGDRYSASDGNRVRESLSKLTRMDIQYPSSPHHIKMMKLDEVGGPLGDDNLSGTSPARHPDIFAQFYDATAKEYQDTDPKELWKNFTDPYGVPWDEGEQVLCVQLHQSGQYVPVKFTAVRHARTCVDASTEYPDDPCTVYPIKFTVKPYTKIAGPQTITTTTLGEALETPVDDLEDYAAVISSDAAYIPEGTDIVVYRVKDRWYIIPPTVAQSDLTLFELTADLPLGGEANAVKMAWNPATTRYVSTGEVITVRDAFNDSAVNPGAFVGSIGYRGWAKRPAANEGMDSTPVEGEQPRWPIVFLEHKAEMIAFVATEDMNEAVASRMAVTVERFWNGKDPGSTVNVWDEEGLFYYAMEGAKGVARWDDKQDRYVVIECQTKAGYVLFTTTADRSTPPVLEEIAATIVDYGGTQQDVQDPAAESFKVWFRDGQFPYALSGADGVARFDATIGKYYVEVCNQRSTFVEVTIDANMCGNEVPSIDGWEATDAWPFSQEPREADLEDVVNPWGLKASDGDSILLRWDESRKKYVVDEVPWYDEAVHAGSVSIDGCGLAFAQKYVSTMRCGMADPADVTLSLYSVDVVRATRQLSEPSMDPSSSVCKLQQYTQTLCSFTEEEDVDDIANVASWTDVMTFSPVPVLKAEAFTNADGLYWVGVKTFTFSPCFDGETDVSVNVIPTTDQCEAPPE